MVALTMRTPTNRRCWKCLAGSCALLLYVSSLGLGGFAFAADKPRFVRQGDKGKLAYQADARGNRVPDFSHCGYQGGDTAIPDAPVRVVVSAAKGDNGPRIQAAIDHVAQLPADGQGIRGAVLLLAGRHEVTGCLRITTSGVVLRGQDGTVLIAKGVDRRPLIQIAGKADRSIVSRAPYAIADRYVPVGAHSFRLTSAEGLRVGDTILIEHPSTAAWIAALGMDNAAARDATGWLRWLPGKMDLQWDRVITKIEGNVITLDAPLTSALDAALAGCWGQFVGDRGWQAPNEFVKPVSLYLGQLAERRGDKAVAALKRRPIPCEPGAARSIDELAPRPGTASRPNAAPSRPLAVKNGWLVCGERLLTGSRGGTVWWRGSILPSRAGELGVGLTRFVPGRTGPGYTDDLDELAEAMRASGQAVLEHHWGLWYDRRRDDHQMVRRIDAEVWPPFYEQPWARSGKGSAWDGLSKYDLARYNPWYFGRLKQFADRCRHKGLALVHHTYFQHNILEAGAHWADFPWRSANCLQETGFPEPPPYVNKKRIFMADAFYDVTHPIRRQLHRAYVRHCLDTLGDSPNVIYQTGEEYTGPLEFVQFWLDTVREWQKETGKKVLIGLSCTKDVQDAILADPVRGPSISVIDLRYWWYAADGSLYAPKGGRSLAPRQLLREWKGPKSRSDAQIARQVREYRLRYPDKAVLCSLDRADGWTVVAAGGSVPNLPGLRDERLLAALPRMKPFEPAGGLGPRQWALAEPGRSYLVYSLSGEKVRLDLSAAEGSYTAFWIDPRTGACTEAEEAVPGGRPVVLTAPGSAPSSLLWLVRR